jgi:hypothetical protein
VRASGRWYDPTLVDDRAQYDSGAGVYAPTDHVVMVNRKLRDSPHWRLWAPISRAVD